MNRHTELAEGLAAVRERIRLACLAAHRPTGEVTLVAVSKTRPVSDTRILLDLGVTDFAESREQELRAKAAALPSARWHFVGRLQSNKARQVAATATVVESCDRLTLVGPLAAGAETGGRRLDVLLQVSLDGDPARGGVTQQDLPGLAAAVAEQPRLRLAGLMAVAPRLGDAAQHFALLRPALARLCLRHPDATTISAGMSGDLEAAVAAGATQVRVGTALFGPRDGALR